MILLESNRNYYIMKERELLYLTLKKHFDIISPQIGMFPVDNIYGRLPYLVVKFKNITNVESQNLLCFIKNYNGLMKWDIHQSRKYSSYIIEPKANQKAKNIKRRDFSFTQHIKEIVDICIKDLPLFTKELDIYLDNSNSSETLPTT